MRRIVMAAPLVLLSVLAASACNRSAGGSDQASNPTSPAPVTSAPHVTTGDGGNGGGTGQATPPTSGDTGWPSPEDCVSYNPGNLTTHYEAGIWTVNDGTTEVVRLQGDPASSVGQQGLALAQRYTRHCFIGRGNTRSDKASYIFDYWRGSSGRRTTIPDDEDACSSYNPHNLTADDMGNGDGWRVKDHDHVLQLFDNQTDATNGKLVLARYDQICFIGQPNDDTQDQISYFV